MNGGLRIFGGHVKVSYQASFIICLFLYKDNCSYGDELRIQFTTSYLGVFLLRHLVELFFFIS